MGCTSVPYADNSHSSSWRRDRCAVTPKTAVVSQKWDTLHAADQRGNGKRRDAMPSTACVITCTFFVPQTHKAPNVPVRQFGVLRLFPRARSPTVSSCEERITKNRKRRRQHFCSLPPPKQKQTALTQTLHDVAIKTAARPWTARCRHDSRKVHVRAERRGKGSAAPCPPDPTLQEAGGHQAGGREQPSPRDRRSNGGIAAGVNVGADVRFFVDIAVERPPRGRRRYRRRGGRWGCVAVGGVRGRGVGHHGRGRAAARAGGWGWQ